MRWEDRPYAAYLHLLRQPGQHARARLPEIPIFPPVEKCIWPPAHTMDNDAFMEYSGANNLDPG
jgi:hypothetical protein